MATIGSGSSLRKVAALCIALVLALPSAYSVDNLTVSLAFGEKDVPAISPSFTLEGEKAEYETLEELYHSVGSAVTENIESRSPVLYEVHMDGKEEGREYAVQSVTVMRIKATELEGLISNVTPGSVRTIYAYKEDGERESVLDSTVVSEAIYEYGSEDEFRTLLGEYILTGTVALPEPESAPVPEAPASPVSVEVIPSAPREKVHSIELSTGFGEIFSSGSYSNGVTEDVVFRGSTIGLAYEYKDYFHIGATVLLSGYDDNVHLGSTPILHNTDLSFKPTLLLDAMGIVERGFFFIDLGAFASFSSPDSTDRIFTSLGITERLGVKAEVAENLTFSASLQAYASLWTDTSLKAISSDYIIRSWWLGCNASVLAKATF